MHQPICDCSFGVIWINKNNCNTLLFIFAFLFSRGYWVEKSLNAFGFKNINLSMLEIWIDSDIQIYNNNNNQMKYYRSWRMWLGGVVPPPPFAHATAVYMLCIYCFFWKASPVERAWLIGMAWIRGSPQSIHIRSCHVIRN